MVVLVAVIGLCAIRVEAAGSEHAPPLKEQIITLLKSITMKLNYAVDEKFCRQFFEDFQTQKDMVHVQPMIQADRYDDPALAAFVGKCPTVRWVGALPDDDPEGSALNTRPRGQAGNRSVGTAHFRLYKVDINNNRKDGAEYVFYSDGFVPEPLPGEEPGPVEELDKTHGQYLVVDFEYCLSLGGIEAGRGGTSVLPVYHGIIRYHGRSYIYDLNASGGYKLYLDELTNRRKTFKTICRYWQ
jgi:hypothetical protein